MNCNESKQRAHWKSEAGAVEIHKLDNSGPDHIQQKPGANL